MPDLVVPESFWTAGGRELGFHTLYQIACSLSSLTAQDLVFMSPWSKIVNHLHTGFQDLMTEFVSDYSCILELM